MHFVIIIITTGFYSQHEHNNYVTDIITSLTAAPELRGVLQLPELHARYATGGRELHQHVILALYRAVNW